MALSFAWQRKKHSRLVSQELCPFLWGIGRDFTSHRRSCFFFIFCKISKWSQLASGN